MTICTCEAVPEGADFGADRTPQLRGKVRVLVDGEDVTDSCEQGKEGTDGWAKVWLRDQRGNRYMCDNPRPPESYRTGHAAYQILRGDVKVVPK